MFFSKSLRLKDDFKQIRMNRNEVYKSDVVAVSDSEKAYALRNRIDNFMKLFDFAPK